MTNPIHTQREGAASALTNIGYLCGRLRGAGVPDAEYIDAAQQITEVLKQLLRDEVQP